jgi:hypothetical protein
MPLWRYCRGVQTSVLVLVRIQHPPMLACTRAQVVSGVMHGLSKSATVSLCMRKHVSGPLHS